MKGIKYWDTKKNKHVLAYHIEENGYAYNKKKTLLIGVVGLDLIESDGFFSQIKKDAGTIDADELSEAAFKYAKDLYKFAKDEDIKESSQYEAFIAGAKYYIQTKKNHQKEWSSAMDFESGEDDG